MQQDVSPISPEGVNLMLVLSRKKGEAIVIGNDITIVVISIEGGRVKLGIDAPQNVEVHRKEIAIAKRNNKTQE